MRLNRTLVLAAVALAIVAVLVASFGGIGELFSYECRRVAEAMQVNWVWDPIKGCFIQQPSGAWIPIDNGRTYNP